MTYIHKVSHFSLAATCCSPAVKDREGNTDSVPLEVTREIVRRVQHIVQKLGATEHILLRYDIPDMGRIGSPL